MAIKDGDKVTLHYTGKTGGETFDTSEGREPLKFTVGQKQVIKGFEDAVMGMEKGGKKTFDIAPEEGYGPRHEELVKEIPRDKIPTGKELKEGMVLQMKMPDNTTAMMQVVKVTDSAITIDMNHPLAGKKLTFEIKIVDVENGSE
ncbi:MAG: peptidylprolyl isomerase [Candidatus Nanoarchaeia archaeon]